jgi:hypothetical protein
MLVGILRFSTDQFNSLSLGALHSRGEANLLGRTVGSDQINAKESERTTVSEEMELNVMRAHAESGY